MDQIRLLGTKSGVLLFERDCALAAFGFIEPQEPAEAESEWFHAA
jgi:hypothetical protein